MLRVVIVGLLFVAPAVGQSVRGAVVADVAVTGLSRLNEAYVLSVARVKVGDVVDDAELDKAVSRLLQTGRLLAARYELSEGANGVTVTFHVTERAVLEGVEFEGNHRFRDRQMRKRVALKVGESIDWFAVREGRQSLLELYREAGFADVGISFDRDRFAETGILVFTVTEAERTKVRRVDFEGNVVFSDRVLRSKISTKKAFWFIRPGAFDEEQVAADAGKVQKYYRDAGYLDARVSYRRESEKKGLRVVFVVSEGDRYTFESIDFVGVTAFSHEELSILMNSQVGSTVHRPQIDLDVRSIRSRYWELGYIHARVTPVRVFSATPGLVQLSIEVEEGDRYRVGHVRVRGNKRTKDKVVRRTLGLYPPDDWFDLNEVKAAERRLMEMQIFGSARVLPTGDAPDVRDVVMDVTEAERSGDFLFGLGVTSNSGVVGTVVLDLKNFDLHDRPRSWSELYKFRSFFGAGQHMRIEMQPGTDLSRFRIDFTEPYLLDRPIRFDAGAYLFERGRDGYTERRGGVSLSLGKRISSGRFRGWNGELALRLERVSISDTDLFSARDIRDAAGDRLATSIKGTLVRDRTDSRFIPTEGDRLRVSYEQFGLLGGDYDFGRLTVRYKWYKTIKTDVLDRKSVLRLLAHGGAIIGDAPMYERFYAGGTGTIRGFEYRGIGPRDGLDDNNIGGDYLVLLGAEYSYPLFGETVRGHVFMDTGTVGRGAYRVAVGTGVRLTINVLGPVPLEFNLAMPVMSDGDDDVQVFSFVIGGLF